MSENNYISSKGLSTPPAPCQHIVNELAALGYTITSAPLVSINQHAINGWIHPRAIVPCRDRGQRIGGAE